MPAGEEVTPWPRSWDRSQPTTRTGNGLQAAGPWAPLPHGPGLPLGNKHVEVYGSRVAGGTEGAHRVTW